MKKEGKTNPRRSSESRKRRLHVKSFDSRTLIKNFFSINYIKNGCGLFILICLFAALHELSGVMKEGRQLNPLSEVTWMSVSGSASGGCGMTRFVPPPV